MPSSPFNFATLAASSQTKLFGGNILQVPLFVSGAPNTSYQYGWMFENWTSGANVYPNWVLPQLKAWAARGANVVRCIGPNDAVLQGSLTQTAANAALTTMLNDMRSLGLVLGFSGMGVTNLAAIGSPSAAAIWAVTKSEIDNVFSANQDIVAYIEPGNQESYGSDIAVNNSVCGLMKAYSTIPVLASTTIDDVSGYTSSYVDVFGLHAYPEILSFPATFDGMKDYLYNCMITTSGKPIHLEEFGYGYSGSATFQQKMDWFTCVFQACFGHPNVVGCTPFSGFGPTLDGDWNSLSCPGSFDPNAFNPATIWQDTVASDFLWGWGPQNRNMSFLLSLNGSQSVTTSASHLNVNAATQASAGTITNINLQTQVWQTTPISLAGTFSLTGDPSTTYTLSLVIEEVNTSAMTVIGSTSVTGSASNQAFSLSGTMPSGPYTPFVQVQATSGSVSGTMTGLAATMEYGVAPTLSLSRGGRLRAEAEPPRLGLDLPPLKLALPLAGLAKIIERRERLRQQ